MKYLITGAGGFIGSYLAKHLSDQGEEVTALSRSFSHSLKQTLSNCSLIEEDILSPNFSALDFDADVAVHLASANDRISKDFKQGVDLSLYGTRQVLNSCIKNKIGKLIFFSTFQVYGQELESEISEDSEIKCESDYAFNHYIVEEYLRFAARKQDLQITTVRPANVYGPFLSPDINRWSLVPGCFCKAAVEDAKIVLLSSGKQNRNFVSLESVSEAIRVISEADITGYQILNIASSQNKSILEAAQIVKKVFEEVFSKSVELEVQSELPRASNEFHVKIDKLLKLGFQENQKMSLESAIKDILLMLQKSDAQG